MGLRFRKSIKLGGLRINFSKSGIGYSYGVKGLRYTKTANGKDRITASIPGTGISYVEESARKKRKGSSTQPVVPEPKKNYRIPLAIKILAVLCGIGFVAYYMVQRRKQLAPCCTRTSHLRRMMIPRKNKKQKTSPSAPTPGEVPIRMPAVAS